MNKNSSLPIHVTPSTIHIPQPWKSMGNKKWFEPTKNNSYIILHLAPHPTLKLDTICVDLTFTTRPFCTHSFLDIHIFCTPPVALLENPMHVSGCIGTSGIAHTKGFKKLIHQSCTELAKGEPLQPHRTPLTSVGLGASTGSYLPVQCSP